MAKMFPSGFYKVCCKGDTGVWGFLGLWGFRGLRGTKGIGFAGPVLSGAPSEFWEVGA